MKLKGYAGRKPDSAKKGQAWPGSLTPPGYEVVKSSGDMWSFRKVNK